MNLRLLRQLRAVSKFKPVSDLYGLDRGQAVDRFYIEGFLGENSKAIKGSCLELLNNNYTKQFGKSRVVRSDVLDIDKKNPHATIYGDLRNLKNIKPGTYDCIILTQVLQFIDEPEKALRECHRVLKEDGVLLATVPALSRADVASGVDNDFWRFTAAGAKYLTSQIFGSTNVEARAHGNVLAGLGFWVGLAQEDLSKADLEHNDPNFPVLVTVRATKK